MSLENLILGKFSRYTAVSWLRKGGTLVFLYIFIDYLNLSFPNTIIRIGVIGFWFVLTFFLFDKNVFNDGGKGDEFGLESLISLRFSKYTLAGIYKTTQALVLLFIFIDYFDLLLPNTFIRLGVFIFGYLVGFLIYDRWVFE